MCDSSFSGECGSCVRCLCGETRRRFIIHYEYQFVLNLRSLELRLFWHLLCCCARNSAMLSHAYRSHRSRGEADPPAPHLPAPQQREANRRGLLSLPCICASPACVYKAVKRVAAQIAEHRNLRSIVVYRCESICMTGMRAALQGGSKSFEQHVSGDHTTLRPPPYITYHTLRLVFWLSTGL